MIDQEQTATQQRMDAMSAMTRVSLHDEKPSRIRRIFSPLLLAVFFVALLLALIAGVSVYRVVTGVQADNASVREGAGLICNVVRANDAKGAIAVGQGPEGKSLVVVETLDSGTYETRFYLHEGKIVQEYSLATNAYAPERATEVTESNTFDFSYSGGLLRVTTDQGTAEVALRYTQGGQ